MRARARSNQGKRVGPSVLTTSLLGLFIPAVAGFGQQCQNQAEIDVCKAGCTATSAACEGLCDFTSGACWLGCQAAFGACDLGCDTCDTGCDICCPTLTCNCDDCRGSCDDCRSSCNGARASCESGCRLDCDDCIFDCKSDCESICRPFKQIGESCAPLVDRCADGLTCWPFLFQCFPTENDELYDDDTCLSFYSSDLHSGAISLGTAQSYGGGGASAVGASETLETGTVYGVDGRYGCYLTTCLGGTTDVEVGAYASTGLYTSYDDFKGESVAFVEEAGDGVVFSTSQIINTSGDLIGTADCLSLEVSLAPIAVGAYDCTTIVNTVGQLLPDGSLERITNSPPQAFCADQSICADPKTCVADASVDNGSVDPDFDPLTVFVDPPGPYVIGESTVTLTARDPEGASSACIATVQVDDCTPPEITCPESLVVECEGDGETFLDPGEATVFDCTEVTVTSYEPQSFPLGTTTLVYEAQDTTGATSMCEQTITVFSDDSDGDGLVDCLDACPFVRANSLNGCGSAFVGGPVEAPAAQPLPDDDGDGVANNFDLCPDTADGVEVDQDGCPVEPPVPAPVPDADGDGVPDDKDQCMDTPSGDSVDENGCTIDQGEGQSVPEMDPNVVETQCGPIDLSALALLALGCVAMGLLPSSRIR